MKHLVMFSGGAMSWAAAKRVVERYGTDGVTLLFADTRMEDEDLYRFLADSERDIGITITRLQEGRTPWEVFRDEKFLGNSRIDPCSRILKRKLLNDYRDEHYDKADVVVHFGLGWDEINRFERVAERSLPWKCSAPMTERPFLTKRDVLDWMVTCGITPPRLYAMGFAHNNCGGFCVKSGQGQFARLLALMPDRYSFHEEQEQRIREALGDVSIMRGCTMKEFRERVVRRGEVDMFDIGGCGCAIE